MICPKCGFEQPESPECVRCGIVISRYKGPVLGAAAPRPAAFPDAAEPHNEPMTAGPPPPPAAAGTVYGDPPPTLAIPGGGTLYAGPMPPTAARPAPTAGTYIAKTPPLQKLRIGEVLSDAFSIYFKNIIPFLILTALAFAPIFLLGGVLAGKTAANDPATLGKAGLILLASLVLCIPISTASITYGVFQEMRGRSSSLGSCLRKGLSSLAPVLLVAILQILLIFGAALVSAIPIAFLIVGIGAAARGSAGCSLLLVPLAFLTYVLPTALMLKYFVAVPAAVEERPGAWSALQRSAFLTAGQRWPIFGVLLVLTVINLGVALVSALVPFAGPVLGPLTSLVMLGVFSTACAVVYYRLRSLKESIDVDQIASVFA